MRDLRVSFDTLDGRVEVVRGVDLDVARGETLGIVGETGCGKSVTASALMGLVPTPPGRVTASRFQLEGADVAFTEAAMRGLRGRRIAMIFQDPATALNPVFPVGDPLRAVIRRHLRLDARGVRAKALEWLERVGLPQPERVAASYPHQLSGGMKQRVAIAMALAPGPVLVLADEPTTALDVTVQAQVLRLLRALQADLGVGMLFISHDLGVIHETCRRVAVMYAGRIVEEATVAALFEAPAHPYTRGLFAARPPSPGPVIRTCPQLRAIPGSVPPPSRLPEGCAFHPRCARADEQCRAAVPTLEAVREGHRVACFHPHE